MKKQVFIAKNHDGEWTCICGNTALDAGFYPCDELGQVVEPTEKDWKTNWYICYRCGRIIHNYTSQVLGQRQILDYCFDDKSIPEKLILGKWIHKPKKSSITHYNVLWISQTEK